MSRLGVVGAGTMGAGIAQLGCLGGFQVSLHDPDAQALGSASDRISSALAKGAGKGLWSAEEAARAVGALKTVAFEGLAGCDLVIEAAPEDLALKRELFARLEETCGPDTVLASNTSSIPVGEIAAEASEPARICGMHFFNPPPLMKLVEVIGAEATGENALERVSAAAEAMGRTPVRATDSPGFIVNRCNRPYALEALRIMAEGLADHAAIDTAMREGGGYRMGPFELMDLIGVDVNLAVAESFYSQRAEPRWEPSSLQKEMVADGKLGRKTGRGFYEYRAGRKVDPDESRSDLEPVEILERIVSALVNEASFAVAEGVASEADVDTAMRLGLNHPRGPFEWRDDMGAARVVGILDALADASSDGQAERYTVAEPLRAAA